MFHLFMLWTRSIIFGLPLTLALAATWSAVQSIASRDLGGDEIVIATAEGLTPSLNPFLPATAVDRELTQLVHAPVLSLNDKGEIQPGLAQSWSWTQRTSFWFSNESFAQKALEKVKALSPEQWQAWQLQDVQAMGAELRLRLSGISTTTGTAVHQVVAEFGPLPVETLHVEVKGDAQEHLMFFMGEAIEAAQVKAVHFLSADSFELQISGEAVRFFEEINKYFSNLPALDARLRFVKRAPMLEQPTLELVLREDATFQDGTRVTGADIETTVNLILSQDWPVDGRRGLQLIDGWDHGAAMRPRLAFREIYGPSIMSLVNLPILPKRWVEAHAARLTAGERSFVNQPPVGAGAYQLDGDDPAAIFISKRGGTGSRVQFVLNQTPAAIRAGFAIRRVDAFWPGPGSLALLDREHGVTLRHTTPRNRLLVMWNCRKAPASDTTVRQALGLMIPRQALAEEWSQGSGAVIEGLFQPGLWFARQTRPAEVDVMKARELLYNAGWIRDESGLFIKNGKTLRFELLTVAGNVQRINLATRLQQIWRKEGVDAVVKAIPWEEMLNEALPSRQYDAALMGLDFERTWDQYDFWHSSQARRGLNFSGIEDGGVDTLLEALRLEYDTTRVSALAHDLEARLAQLHPFLPLFAGGEIVAIREDAFPAMIGRNGDELENNNPGGFSLRQVLEVKQKDQP